MFPLSRPPSAPVDSQGAFTIVNVPPGRYSLVAHLAAPNDAAAAPAARMRIGPDDVANGVLDVGDAPLSGLVVDVSRRPSGLRGTLAASSALQAHLTVVIFPTDTSLRHPGSGRLALAPIARDGTWEVVGVPPGEYLVGVVALAEAEAIFEPEFLSELERVSHRATVTIGEMTEVALRTGRNQP